MIYAPMAVPEESRFAGSNPTLYRMGSDVSMAKSELS